MPSLFTHTKERMKKKRKRKKKEREGNYGFSPFKS